MGQVEFIEVTKRYGDATAGAVTGIDLVVEDHEFLVLLGPSGCGKSTLLKLVAGLEDITSGEIWIDGRMVNYEKPADRDVAMVFQNYALYPHMTVSENVAFPLRMTGVAKEETRQRVLAAASSLGLDPYLERRPEHLSGGQRQRVALARSIVRRPSVFLMDEPLSNLDAQLRVQTREELLRLHASLQTTTIYVTHDQVEAMTMGHRIAVMRSGVIQQVGPPQHVYDHPANTFVAAFLGSPRINLAAGRFESSPTGAILAGPDFAVPLPPRLAEAARGAGDAAFGIRPENIALHLADPGGGAFPAKVSLVEPVGSDLYVNASTGSSSWTARAAARTPVTPGQQVWLVFDLEHAHLFGGDGAALT